jgi:zinc transporter ZupT
MPIIAPAVIVPLVTAVVSRCVVRVAAVLVAVAMPAVVVAVIVVVIDAVGRIAFVVLHVVAGTVVIVAVHGTTAETYSEHCKDKG